MQSWYVSSHQPLLPMGQPWEVELSFLVHLFSLGSLLVSVHYQFLQGGEMFSFHQTEVMPHATTQVGSAKCVNQWVEFSILAHPTRQFFFLATSFIQKLQSAHQCGSLQSS
jgi:hypothetical protein